METKGNLSSWYKCEGPLRSLWLLSPHHNGEVLLKSTKHSRWDFTWIECCKCCGSCRNACNMSALSTGRTPILLRGHWGRAMSELWKRKPFSLYVTVWHRTRRITNFRVPSLPHLFWYIFKAFYFLCLLCRNPRDFSITPRNIRRAPFTSVWSDPPFLHTACLQSYLWV